MVTMAPPPVKRSRQSPNAKAVSEANATALKDYLEVEVTISWFPTSKQIKGKVAQRMASSVDADATLLRMGKLLFESKHPAVKACNAARAEIDRVVRRFTIPKIAIKRVAVGEAARYAQERDAGVRYIRQDLLEEFHQTVTVGETGLAASVLALHDAMPSIIEFMKAKQSAVFDATDYGFDVRERVSVNVRVLPRRSIADFDLSQLCPKLFEREARIAKAERTLAVQAFADEFTERMSAYVQMFAKQLGPCYRLAPVDAPYTQHQGAAIIDMTPVEDGTVVVTLQPEKGLAKDRFEITGMTEAEFNAAYCPYKTREMRQVKENTILNLRTMLDEFFVKSDAFGAYSDVVRTRVNELQETLGKAAGDLDADAIAKRVRGDGNMRNAIANAMTGLGRSLDDGLTLIRAGRRAVLAGLDLGLPVE